MNVASTTALLQIREQRELLLTVVLEVSFGVCLCNWVGQCAWNRKLGFLQDIADLAFVSESSQEGGLATVRFTEVHCLASKTSNCDCCHRASGAEADSGSTSVTVGHQDLVTQSAQTMEGYHLCFLALRSSGHATFLGLLGPLCLDVFPKLWGPSIGPSEMSVTNYW